VKAVYALLCVAGLVLPYYFFVPYVLANGLHLPHFFGLLFANLVSAFFGADVLVSSVVLWALIYQETRTRRIPLWWLAVAANVAVGVSLGLPLFLWLREREIEREKGKAFAQ
jgi:hypothetical protein